MSNYILDEAGEPRLEPDFLAWGVWYADAEKRRVALDEVFPGVSVSTVFLSIDHNFGGEGPPILWETMVFGGPLAGEEERYSSRAEAEAGHRNMVDRVRAAGPASPSESP
jgi:hypothetical protein